MASLFAFDRPNLDDTAVATILGTHWGIGGNITGLPGERSHNSLVTTAGGEHYVLQVQSSSESADAIELQTHAMQHLQRVAPHLPVNRVISTQAGASLATTYIQSVPHLVRLVTYLPGVTFDPDEALSPDAYRAIGALLGRIGSALSSFDETLPGHFMPWDIGNGLLVDPTMRSNISEASTRSLESVESRLTAVTTAIARLPQQTIHNDGHAGNLLRASPDSHEVTGVIDFGDIAHTAIAADVAIAAESFAPEHTNPGEVTALIAAGYHQHHPLTEADITALPELVLARLALTVVLIELQIRESPHLAARAEQVLPFVIDRLNRWGQLDADQMADHIHRKLAYS